MAEKVIVASNSEELGKLNEEIMETLGNWCVKNSFTYTLTMNTIDPDNMFIHISILKNGEGSINSIHGETS